LEAAAGAPSSGDETGAAMTRSEEQLSIDTRTTRKKERVRLKRCSSTTR
jgi:hypothetical protein